MATTKQQLIDLRAEMNSFSLKIEKEFDEKIREEIIKLSPLKQNKIKKHNSKPHKFDHHPGIFELKEVMYGKYIDLNKFYPWFYEVQIEHMKHIQEEVYEYIGETGIMAIQIENTADSQKKVIRQVHQMNPYQLDDYILALLSATDMAETHKAA